MVSYPTTMQGSALGMAKSAERVLGELRAGALAVKDRPGLAYSAESMAVFGSNLPKAERLNDWHIAVELRAKRDDDASFALRGHSRNGLPASKNAAAAHLTRDADAHSCANVRSLSNRSPKPRSSPGRLEDD